MALMPLNRYVSPSVALLLASFAMPVVAQRVYTAQDYAQAERWMGYNVNSLVQHTIGPVSYTHLPPKFTTALL